MLGKGLRDKDHRIFRQRVNCTIDPPQNHTSDPVFAARKTAGAGAK